MASAPEYRPLSDSEIERLGLNLCTIENNDWARLKVAPGFDPEFVRSVHFEGSVRLGALGEYADQVNGIRSGLYNARLIDCTIGDNVRIENVGVHIARYDIEDHVVIRDAGVLETRSDARFGNGVEVFVLNEGGGRSVTLFDALSSQFAHLLCLHRYRPRMVERLLTIAHRAIDDLPQQRGVIGRAASLRSVSEVVDVRVGAAACLQGCLSLVNGTILSTVETPTSVGAGVEARDFIIAEGACVDGSALVSQTYVGQGARMGRQFSSEHSLFFANCEAFHGEACSVFAGPYSVTHHKGSLLIAGLFSFFNAGSGTNQSNHMYKLGPLHEGRLERGCKTGSFSYLMWPCHVGPFSVVLGKHTRSFDASCLPFSYLEAGVDGKCMLVPGFNLATVGTLRDGSKWPRRDRRGDDKRDHVDMTVFNPMTVGRMMSGIELLDDLQHRTDRSVKAVTIQAVEIKRVFLRTGQKLYRRAALMYLADVVVSRIEQWVAADGRSMTCALQSSPEAVLDPTWVDVGGLVMPAARMEQLCADIESGVIEDIATFHEHVSWVHACYRDDEWLWVKEALKRLTGLDVNAGNDTSLAAVGDLLLENRRGFLEAVLADTLKEFDSQSSIGFGIDGPSRARGEDFEAVRGGYDKHPLVMQLRQEIELLPERVDQFKNLIQMGSQ